ncbi:MAG: GNAT family N-acetyltransferase [bacterium]
MWPCTEDDIDALHKIWIHPNVREFLWDDVIISREQAAEIVLKSIDSYNEKRIGFWCIHQIEKETTIGFCGLGHYGKQPEIEVFYGLDPQHWGRGFATEAVGAMLRYGFEELGYAFILSGANPSTEASFLVVEKLGMKPVKRVFVEALNGEDIEVVYYGIKRDEFQPGDADYCVVKS